MAEFLYKSSGARLQPADKCDKEFLGNGGIPLQKFWSPVKTRSHSQIKSSELTAANRRIVNTHSSDLPMKSP